jgi:hypothetical protein
MFRAAYRSSSGAPNSIWSLGFIYPCSDRTLSRLGGNSSQRDLICMPEVPGSLLDRNADYPDEFQHGSVLIFQKPIQKLKTLGHVTCWGSVSIRRQHTKFGCRGDQATWICARLFKDIIIWQNTCCSPREKASILSSDRRWTLPSA